MISEKRLHLQDNVKIYYRSLEHIEKLIVQTLHEYRYGCISRSTYQSKMQSLTNIKSTLYKTHSSLYNYAFEKGVLTDVQKSLYTTQT